MSCKGSNLILSGTCTRIDGWYNNFFYYYLSNGSSELPSFLTYNWYIDKVNTPWHFSVSEEASTNEASRHLIDKICFLRRFLTWNGKVISIELSISPKEKISNILMFELYIRKRHFRSTYIQRKCWSQFPASRLKSVDTIGSYCEITRAGCALTSMHDARIQQRYTGGGG